MEVLRLIVEGYSNPEIAEALYLGEHTVRTYVREIMNKLLVNIMQRRYRVRLRAL